MIPSSAIISQRIQESINVSTQTENSIVKLCLSLLSHLWFVIEKILQSTEISISVCLSTFELRLCKLSLVGARFVNEVILQILLDLIPILKKF